MSAKSETKAAADQAEASSTTAAATATAMGSTTTTKKDDRARVAKFIRNEPIFIAVTGTDMKGAAVADRVVEEWTCEGEKDVLQLVEVCYSHSKTHELVNTPRDMMSGPDMYHVRWRDQKPTRLVATVWQVLYLTGSPTVEVVQHKQDVKNSPDTSIKYPAHQLTAAHLLRCAERVTGKRWTRPADADDQALVLTL